ncbi:Cof-type HAD-IIB family hydrolase [Deinococcus sonorensis]|uniref:Cof-type HAD-IIB family hydrolase n=2 Tax=Deinococcus sonorensis TaxID=309891 RepID=A0AAU7UB69_9DEIO
MLGLICIDVDGTLVGSSNEVFPEVWAAAADAVRDGLHLAVCSGRPAFGKAFNYARKLDPSGWHVFQNGASIVNVESGASLSTPFPEHELHRLVEQSRRTGRILEVYTDTEYAVESTERRAVEHAALLGLPYVQRDLLSLQGQVVRVQWVVPLSETQEVLAEPHPGLELHPAGSPGMPDTMFISVTDASVNKGTAIRQIAQKYGLSLDRVMMVGDGHNDVLAMEAVGHPVAMGNADAEALAASRYQVGRVDDLGLLDAFALARQL